MQALSLAVVPERPRERFGRLRTHLLTAEVSHLRVVYFSCARELLLSLSATPNDWATGVELDEALKTRLPNLFCAWMKLAQPDWNDGLEAVGVLDWDVEANAFTHTHSGYTLQPFKVVRRG